MYNVNRVHRVYRCNVGESRLPRAHYVEIIFSEENLTFHLKNET